MDEKVTFDSAGFKLAARLHRPGSDSGKRSAFIVMHGFGSNKDGGFAPIAARLLEELGYVVLRIDMRGCGESEGTRGRVICEEQVEDTRSAISFLARQTGVDPERIGLFGHSFGAAVAIQTAAIDKRVAACVSSGGWGDGKVKFQLQHSTPEAWARFESLMATGREKRAKGEDFFIPRFEIVPIPAELRGNLAPGSITEFPFDTVESMYNFRPISVVADIAPRPLLLIHPSFDRVTPTEQSIDLFRHSRSPSDLHLFGGVDHFLFSEHNPMVIQCVRAWLDKFLPATVQELAA
jgi:pimeloyl-ACP methyl ester carboxylesterase